MQANLREIEKSLWEAADDLRANSGLKSSEYSSPVLGLIFLRFAEVRFEAVREKVEAKASARRKIGPAEYLAEGALYLPPEARFATLLELPESANLGKAINDAMSAVEKSGKGKLNDALPRRYNAIKSDTLFSLLRYINAATKELEGDAFGLIYEYFLAQFAAAEGAGAGEFFTPMSVVQLIVEVIEPFRGRILDPACGSGGMFIQSAKFVERHQGSPENEISIYGQEKTGDTVKLANLNLAVHGLDGDIREGNSYYQDEHKSLGAFDFVMANPPFNVDKIDKAKLEDDKRFHDLPKADNGNYIWIQMFASALNKTGRAGFVMANSASDARHSEGEIRRKLIEEGLVDVMIALSPNFFYTVTLPVTLWFFDRGKAGTSRADQVLFIDARQIFKQVDRAHRDFTDEQRELLVNVVRLYRGEKPEFADGKNDLVAEKFPKGKYADVKGLCKVATIEEIEAQGWSLNPGRYVGTDVVELDDEEFEEQLAAAHAELRELGGRAAELETSIDDVLTKLQQQ